MLMQREATWINHSKSQSKSILSDWTVSNGNHVCIRWFSNLFFEYVWNIWFSQWCFIHLLRGNIFINPAWAVESCHNNYNSSLCINSMLLQELSTGGLVKKNSSLHLLSRRRAKREGETETEAKVDEVSYLNNSISRTLTLDFFLHK